MNARHVACFCVLALSGCTIGYRHTRHVGKISRDIGELDINGSGNTMDIAATFDFRYARLLLPFEVGRHKLVFTADDGGKDTLDLVRERRLYRLDVPVLSLYDVKTKGFGGYPGLMRHRESLELWVSGESNLQNDNEWWIDLSLAFYKYNGVGVRLFFGAGALPFDAATPRPGTRFPALWNGNAPTIGGGLSITVTSGEFALDAFEYLAGIDKKHRERAERQNPGR
jgi:hypothetical protein